MITLKHDPELATKGTWRGFMRTAVVSCPGCGQEAPIKEHHIFYDGTVTPSLVCPFDCGFHDWITLENWKP